MSEREPGYHIATIVQGECGELSKIQEELDEAKDALAQGSEIMFLVELADLYGALELVVEQHGHTMDDLKKFSDITKRAFINGHRK